jgi:hypothetical protein
MANRIDKTPIKNIALNKGEDYSVVGDFTDTKTGQNVDISGDTFRAEVREYAGAAAVLATFTFTLFQDAADGDKWKYERAMAQSIINAIPNKTAVWDQFRTSGGKTSKILTGTVEFNTNVTEPST